MNRKDLTAWLRARLPADLLAQEPDIRHYPDEIVIVLALAAPEPGDERDLIARLREETRPLRVRLARELQRELGLPVAWGMRAGASEELFTTRSTPVMTRLGRAERDVLDALVAAGVAETRSAALGYVVRAFAADHADWLDEVRETAAQMERLRARLRDAPGEPPPGGRRRK